MKIRSWGECGFCDFIVGNSGHTPNFHTLSLARSLCVFRYETRGNFRPRQLKRVQFWWNSCEIRENGCNFYIIRVDFRLGCVFLTAGRVKTCFWFIYVLLQHILLINDVVKSCNCKICYLLRCARNVLVTFPRFYWIFFCLNFGILRLGFSGIFGIFFVLSHFLRLVTRFVLRFILFTKGLRFLAVFFFVLQDRLSNL